MKRGTVKPASKAQFIEARKRAGNPPAEEDFRHRWGDFCERWIRFYRGAVLVAEKYETIHRGVVGETHYAVDPSYLPNA
jgi:hypothetical protein